MNTKVYVGNLPFSSSEDSVKDLFATCGNVSEVNLIMDRESGYPKGFGFVTMEDVDSMRKAIKELDGKEHEGRELKVNEARPRENRSFDGGGGGGYDNNRGRNNNNNRNRY